MISKERNFSLPLLVRLYNEKELKLEDAEILDIDFLTLIKNDYPVVFNVEEDRDGIVTPITKRDADLLYSLIQFSNQDFDTISDKRLVEYYQCRLVIVDDSYVDKTNLEDKGRLTNAISSLYK